MILALIAKWPGRGIPSGAGADGGDAEYRRQVMATHLRWVLFNGLVFLACLILTVPWGWHWLAPALFNLYAAYGNAVQYHKERLRLHRM